MMNGYSLRQVRIPFEAQLSSWFEGNATFYQQVFQNAKAAKEIYGSYGIR